MAAKKCSRKSAPEWIRVWVRVTAHGIMGDMASSRKTGGVSRKGVKNGGADGVRVRFHFIQGPTHTHTHTHTHQKKNKRMHSWFQSNDFYFQTQTNFISFLQCFFKLTNENSSCPLFNLLILKQQHACGILVP